MKYSACTAFLGCLPEAEPTLHDTPAEAWEELLEIMGDDRWAPDDEDDPDGPHHMRRVALNMEQFQRENRTGTVYDDNRFYEVDWVADFEVGEPAPTLNEAPC